jgi:hypothetical protein
MTPTVTVNRVETQSICVRAVHGTTYKAGGTGLEPATNSEVNDNGCCIYVNCQEGCAANALHPEFLKCLEVALIDADLLTVIGAWKGLPEEIRKTVMLLAKAK